jgi:hypothetical protein
MGWKIETDFYMLFFRFTTYNTLFYLLRYNINVIYNYLSNMFYDNMQICYIYKFN